jgi:hypothetical protein
VGTTAAPTNALLNWFAEWGQFYYIGAQVIFWIAIAVAALVVAFQYKRFVSHKVGDTAEAKHAAPEVKQEHEAFAE